MDANLSTYGYGGGIDLQARKGSLLAFTDVNGNVVPVSTVSNLQYHNQKMASSSVGKDPRIEPDRSKWSGEMVRLLIKAVSYLERQGTTKMMKREEHWKTISKVMAERSYLVTPKQCEYKFNDLNNMYKKLNEILGRGTCCDKDVLDHVSISTKQVRKIPFSSENSYYQEMCSYHNGNSLHLPPDPELHHSLALALKSENIDKNEDDQMVHDQLRSCSNELEQKRLWIKQQMVELEKQRLTWMETSMNKDKELEMMKREIQKMKVENEQMAIELRQREMGIGNKAN